MRILMLNYEFPPLGGGGGVAAKTLAKGFIKSGHEVDYITTRYEGSKAFETIDGINVYRVNVIGKRDLSTASFLSMVSFPLMTRKLAHKLCKERKYDLINTHFALPTGPLGVHLSKKFKIKNILCLHGGDIYDPTKKMSPHRNLLFRKTVEYVINNSDIVVAQSKNTRDNTIKHYKIKKDVKIVPLAYQKFDFAKTSRKELGLSKNKKYIITIGRLIWRKGFHLLIKSLPLINKDVELIIIGDGPMKQDLQKLSTSLKVESRVHFLGYLTEARKFQYLDNSDLYVLSSMHEGFGIVLQEAMQVGLPIITTINGGQVDFMQSNINCLFADYNESDIAKKINILLSDKEKYDYLSKNNIFDLTKFEPNRIVNEYFNLLK